MLVEGEHLAYQLAAVVHGGSHAIVDLHRCEYGVVYQASLVPILTKPCYTVYQQSVHVNAMAFAFEVEVDLTYHLALLVRRSHAVVVACRGTSLLLVGLSGS